MIAISVPFRRWRSVPWTRARLIYSLTMLGVMVAVVWVTSSIGASAVANSVAAPPASANDAAAYIRQLGNRAIAIFASSDGQGNAQQRVDTVKSIILENVDLEAIGRFVLGNHWREMSDAQRARYQKAYRTYVLIATARRLEAYRFSHFHVASGEPLPQGDILVNTVVDRPDESKILVGWRVRKETGSFKIVDVFVEGVSLALTQRQEFASIIARQGVPGLINLIEGKVAEFQAARPN